MISAFCHKTNRLLYKQTSFKCGQIQNSSCFPQLITVSGYFSYRITTSSCFPQLITASGYCTHRITTSASAHYDFHLVHLSVAEYW
jgi:hypothetical protein